MGSGTGGASFNKQATSEQAEHRKHTADNKIALKKTQVKTKSSNKKQKIEKAKQSIEQPKQNKATADSMGKPKQQHQQGI